MTACRHVSATANGAEATGIVTETCRFGGGLAPKILVRHASRDSPVSRDNTSRDRQISRATAMSSKCGGSRFFFGGAVRGLPDLYKVSLLALTAGVLLTVAVEEMVAQAHQTEDTRWDSLALVGGFALFALVAVYFG